MIIGRAFGSKMARDKKRPAGGRAVVASGKVSWRSLQLMREGRAAASRDRQRHQRAALEAARVVEKERLFMAIWTRG
jgi:hypothetical protein